MFLVKMKVGRSFETVLERSRRIEENMVDDGDPRRNRALRYRELSHGRDRRTGFRV